MLSTLYSIASGIALTIGALGASDDFDGAKLAQNAFFGPEEESELMDNQEMTTEEVQVVTDVDQWDEIAAQVMSMSLTSKDELTDDEKLEIAVLTEEMPIDETENQEFSQVEEISQPEGLSEEEFLGLLDRQYTDAMTLLAAEEVADSEPIVIESVDSPKTEDNLEELAAVELQPEDDVNAEKALEVVQSEQEIQVNDISENVFQEEKPWVVVHGLPDIPDEDMNVLMDQKASQQPETEDVADVEDIENVTVNEIPVMESIDVDLPDIEAPEIEDIEAPLFDEAENIEENAEETEEVEAEETEAEEVQADETEADEAEETEAEEVQADETEADEAEETEAEDAAQSEAQAEDAVEEVKPEDEEFGIVGPLEIDDEETLVIPSTEIPPAVVSEQEKAKINAEIDALVDQSENFNSWIPRQIPVAGQVDESKPETKPEDDFIQNFSKQNVKESILENDGINLN